MVAVTAPGSISPSVSVAGPNGYTQAVTATTTLTGLAPGSYTVTAASVTGSNAIVATVNAAVVSGSPASVSVGSPDTVTVTYGVRAGTGGLWVGNFDGPTVLDYTASQLGATSGNAPTTAVATGVNDYNFSLAFDANGNLWVSTFLNGSILEFSASDLGKSGSPTPTVTVRDSIAGHTLGTPLGLAFDAKGNLWVADLNDNAIEEYTPSQLASSGAPNPAVILSTSGASTEQPSAVAFDSSGNLWVADVGSASKDSGHVVEFTADQLTSSGSPTPAITLNQLPADSSIWGAVSIAFDGSGNLWIANGDYGVDGPNTVVMFSANELVASGDPTPAVILRPSSGSLASPAGLAFDASGNLWVGNLTASTLVQFTASQLVSSGSPTPNVTISGSSLLDPAGLAFDPTCIGTAHQAGSARERQDAVARGQRLKPMKAR